jgi:hypothetical protein
MRASPVPLCDGCFGQTDTPPIRPTTRRYPEAVLAISLTGLVVEGVTIVVALVLLAIVLRDA